MALQTYPNTSKTRYLITLTSGTSWTVPSGVKYVNVTLRGGGGGGGGGIQNGTYGWIAVGSKGHGGQVVTSTLAVTPGAAITYTIGAGGAGGSSIATGTTGGTTSFTGATSATGGGGGAGAAAGGANGTAALSADNGGGGAGSASGSSTGATGGNGSIDIEYWK